MSMADILSALNFLILLGIIGYLMVINKYLNKNDIVNYVSQIFKISEANLKQDLNMFLNVVKEEYTKYQEEILQTLQKQQKEVEKLNEIILKEAKVFQKYCQERLKAEEQLIKQTENRLKEMQKYIAKLERTLSKCRKKVKRMKIENEITR